MGSERERVRKIREQSLFNVAPAVEKRAASPNFGVVMQLIHNCLLTARQ